MSIALFALALAFAFPRARAAQAETGDTGCDPGDTAVRDCDVDGDGYWSRYCCGPDCDDLDDDINPGIIEEIGDTGDRNCDGLVRTGDGGPTPLYLSGGSGTCATSPGALGLAGAALALLALCARRS